jgi:beta-lactamase superfamily II metal-dependent hydrolase
LPRGKRSTAVDLPLLSPMTPIGYEIDFINVGDGERSGDAIAVRYGISGAYKVMVIDGGSKESGQALVNHIRTHYNTDRVDYLVNTHPDVDHASGLEVVLEELTIGEAWVHQPWNYPERIRHWFADGRITVDSLRDRLQDALYHAYRVEELAKKKGVPVREPFAGARIGDLVVVSPSKEWYFEIVAHFDKTPEAKSPVMREGFLKSLVEKAMSWVDEHWNYETLSAQCETSYDNESSVVLYGNIGGHGLLFTGDAGVQALSRAASSLEASGVHLPSTLKFVQIPHHGSRHNVSPSVLDRILGPRVVPGTPTTKTAIVSAGAKSETHPRRIVTNAFKRRGAWVGAAKGIPIRHHQNMPARTGWSTAPEIPFYDKVEG